jgi:hypothetical protein
MQKITETASSTIENAIVFCAKPWPILALGLGSMILLTFAWGFLILSTYSDDDFFEFDHDMSISEFLLRDIANPNINDIVNASAPAVVGIGGGGVNMPVVSSGAVVSSNGHVLTTLHPLRELNEISAHVRTPSGIRRYRAEVVKTLPTHDLVLLKMLTPDPFLFFPLADTSTLQIGARVFGIGHGTGNLVIKEGTVRAINAMARVGDLRLTYLLNTDAVYTWEQTGGPLINGRGQIVGINITLEDASGATVGATVPSHVIAAHFQDVVRFKIVTAGEANAAPGRAVAIPTAAPAPAKMQTLQGSGSGGSASWWARARVQVGKDNPALGMNVVAPNGPPLSDGPPLSAGSGLDAGTPGMLMDPEHLGVTRIAGFQVWDIFAIALLGLAAGLISGMMTMGGGVLHVAGMMVLFGYGMHLIRPVAYLTNIVVFGAAARRNYLAGLIEWKTVRGLTPWAVVGVIAGYFLGNNLDDEAIGVMLGSFALLVALKGLQEIFTHEESKEILIKTGYFDDQALAADDFLEEAINADPAVDEAIEAVAEGADETSAGAAQQAARRQLWNIVLGLPSGLFSGVLGISGGVVSVPLLRFLGAENLRTAIANSSVIVFWASLVGAILAFTHGITTGLIEWQAPVTLAAIMIPGAYFGGILGANLMRVLPVIFLKWFYTIIMTAVAAKMLVLS